MSKVCFLGSGRLLIERAKSLGLSVILIHDVNTVNPNVLNLCDISYLCDLDDDRNRVKILNFLKGENIKHVLTLSEKYLPLAAWLMDALCNVDHHKSLCTKLRNKETMRTHLAYSKFGNVKFLNPAYQKSFEEISNALKLPFIVKPAEGTGSNNIYLIKTKNEFLAIDFKAPYIAEEFIHGG